MRDNCKTNALLVIVLLVALALRLVPFGQNRFLEDEALYAYWGLQIATGADSMLDEEPVDKPPLYPYALALFFSVAAPSQAGIDSEAYEMIARLPSLFASLLSVTLVYALGRQLYHDTRIALSAALLLTLSPFDILFASTAFTDPLMVTFVLGSLLAAASGRMGTAGMLIALASATKQQGLLYLPLVFVLGLLSSPAGVRQSTEHVTWIRRLWGQRWVRFALGFALVALSVIWWDLARVQRPGFFEQSLISYGGLALARPETLAERAVDWLHLAGSFWTSAWFNLLLLLALGIWLVGSRLTSILPAPTRVDLILLVFALGFLALHWLVGFQVWDRYLLGLIPLIALLAARAFVALGDAIHSPRWRNLYGITLALVLSVMLMAPVLQAVRSDLPLGGDHGAYDGIDDLAAYMQARIPAGSVLYHYWLGYHYRFYLYGAPLRLHWYPDLQDLAHDAYIYRREPRYIAFPAWHDGSQATTALAQQGIVLTPVLETTRRDGTTSFRLYRLEGP